MNNSPFIFNPEREQQFRLWLTCFAVFSCFHTLYLLYRFYQIIADSTDNSFVVNTAYYLFFVLAILFDILLIINLFQILEKHKLYTAQQDEFSLQQLINSYYQQLCMFLAAMGVELASHIFWRYLFRLMPS